MAAPRRWIRLDAEWEESAWLDALTGQAAGCWPRLLCWVKLRGKGGRCRTPDLGVLARRWRVPRQAVDELMVAAMQDGAVEVIGDEMVLTNWDEYQEPDPTAAERKRRQREKEHPPPESRTSRRDTRDRGCDPSRDIDPQQGRREAIGESVGPVTKKLAAAAGSVPPAAPANASQVLGNDAARALVAIKPPGGVQAALAAIRASFLYENESEALPDGCVKGLEIGERRQLVGRALVEMHANGKAWNSATLAGFVRNLRSQPITRGSPSPIDQARAEEARRDRAARELEQREAEAEQSERDTREAWEWFEALPADKRAELEREVKIRTSNLGRMSTEVKNSVLLGIISIERKRGAV